MKYIFRGNVVFEYDPETKQVKAGEVCADGYETNVFNFCRFIPEDYKLLAEFFNRCFNHNMGREVDLTDIVVN